MRARIGLLLAMLLPHATVAAVAGEIGLVAGGLAGFGANPATFLFSGGLGAVAWLATRRVSTGMRGDRVAAEWSWLPAAALFGVTLARAANAQQSPFASGFAFEVSQIGTGFCGDMVCAGQVLTAPLAGALGYSLAASLGSRANDVVSWLRRGTIAYVAIWAVVFCALSWTSYHDAVTQFFRHISRQRPLSDQDWCVIAATPAYLSQSRLTKIAVATSFYDTTLGPLAERVYLDAAAFRDSFIHASTDGRIVSPPNEVPSRAFDDIGAPRPRRALGRMTRDAALAALPATVVPLLGVLAWRRRVRLR